MSDLVFSALTGSGIGKLRLPFVMPSGVSLNEGVKILWALSCTKYAVSKYPKMCAHIQTPVHACTHETHFPNTP